MESLKDLFKNKFILRMDFLRLSLSGKKQERHAFENVCLTACRLEYIISIENEISLFLKGKEYGT